MDRIVSMATDFVKYVAEKFIKCSGKSEMTGKHLAIVLGIVALLIYDGAVVRAQGDNGSGSFISPVSQAEQLRFSYWLGLGKGNSPENDPYMSEYTSTLDSLDIFVNKPDSFNLLSEEEISRPLFSSPNPHFKTKYFHCVDGWSIMGPVLESEAKDALFVYPVLIESMGVSPIRKMESELITANENDDLDISDMFSRFQGKDAATCNADEIILYDYDMKEPVKEKYNHTVGVILRKKAHYPLAMKIIMSDEGLKKRDEYIKMLLDNVRYGDAPVKECVEKEKLNRLNEEQLKFPLKKYECKGIRGHEHESNS